MSEHPVRDHVHVMALCRDHSGGDVNIFATKEEAIEFIHNSAPDFVTSGMNVTDIQNTKDSSEFTITHKDGDVHNFITFWRFCGMPLFMCQMMFKMEGITKIAQMAEEDPEHFEEMRLQSEKLRDVQERRSNNVLGDVNLDSTFGSIDDFLKGSGGEQHPN